MQSMDDNIKVMRIFGTKAFLVDYKKLMHYGIRGNPYDLFEP